MTKLPSIQGLRNSQSITVSFTDQLFQHIEPQCRAEWLALHHIDHPNETASPFIPHNILTQTTEGRVHMNLINRLFYVPGFIAGYPRQTYSIAVGLDELNRVMSRVQAQRYTTQGTRRRFSKRVHSATDYRKFRNWWINKNYSEALGVEFTEPCPFEAYQQPGPTESFIEIGQHFEEWTGYKLPKELWDELKADEAKRLAQLDNQRMAELHARAA